MTSIEIKRFNPEKLEELAEQQTKIYNEANLHNPGFNPTKIEDVVNRFKRETFDQSRMFYAYDGDKMVGYAGLTGKNKEQNLRGAGYPWLLKGTDTSVRDSLYAAMEKACKEEGTKILQTFGSPQNQDRLDFFRSKNFQTKVEFLVHERELSKNDIKLPKNYKFRDLKREDLSSLVKVSENDPKMKTPFVLSNWENFMDSPNYDSNNIVIAESGNELVGMYAMFVPNDPNVDRAYFGGVAVDGKHQSIEPYLLQEIENRALEKGKKKFEITFYPDSQRLPLAQERGYKQIRNSYQLEKEL